MLSGCATRGQQQVYVRSKREVPKWIQLPQGQLIPVGQDLRFLTVRQRILDLPLGLKQTQMQAIATMKQRLVEQALAAGSGLEKLTGLDRRKLAQELVQSDVFTSVVVEDIYFESFRKGLAMSAGREQWHRVYILTRFPRAQKVQLDKLVNSSLREQTSRERG
jgi:hypothetical protein